MSTPEQSMPDIAVKIAQLQALAEETTYLKAQLKNVCCVVNDYFTVLHNQAALASQGENPNAEFATSLEAVLSAITAFEQAHFAAKLVQIEKAGTSMKHLCDTILAYYQTDKVGFPENLARVIANWKIIYFRDRLELDASLRTLSCDEAKVDELLQTCCIDALELMKILRNYAIFCQPLGRTYVVKLLSSLQCRVKGKAPLGFHPMTSADVVKDEVIMSSPLTQFYHGSLYNTVKVTIVTFNDRTSPSEIKRELRLWSNLHHPNIIELFGGAPRFAVMPVIRHINVRAYIQVEPDIRKLQVVADATAGLEFLHAHDVVHGEMASANIVIDELGTAKLINFGMNLLYACTVTSSEVNVRRVHFRWLPPESNGIIDINIGDITRAADTYSMATTIWELFVNQTPWYEFDDDGAKAQIAAGKMLPIPTRHFVPTSAWDLIKASWNIEPALRPTSAQLAAEFNLLYQKLRLEDKTDNVVV